jgi:hypothetical protein
MAICWRFERAVHHHATTGIETSSGLIVDDGQ